MRTYTKLNISMLKAIFYQNNPNMGIHNLNPNLNPKKPTLFFKQKKTEISSIEN